MTKRTDLVPVVLRSGICRVCGCTEEKPCILEDRTCWWVDKAHTLCSNPECIGLVPLSQLTEMVLLREHVIFLGG
jgi:hypothetical protein